MPSSLADLNEKQRLGLYHLMSFDSWPPDEEVTVQVHVPTGAAVVTSATNAAVIAANGDFLEPESEPDDPKVRLPFEEYEPLAVLQQGSDPKFNPEMNN